MLRQELLLLGRVQWTLMVASIGISEIYRPSITLRLRLASECLLAYLLIYLLSGQTIYPLHFQFRRMAKRLPALKKLNLSPR